MEIFKDISDYEGLYQVSSFGRVLSLSKSDGNGNRDRMLKQEVMTSNHTNYRRVTLSKGGKVKRFFVHRLVAIHFIENRFDKPQVNHIDNNGENNKIENLEWCNAWENARHSYNQGRLDNALNMATTEAARQAEISTKKKMINLLGDRFISMRQDGGKRLVKFACECGNIHERRSDSVLILRGGSCQRGCKKQSGDDDNF